MSPNAAAPARGGVSFMSLLAILFIGLKLTGHIDWSWWMVLSPLWVPIAALVSFIGAVALLSWIVRDRP